MPVHAARVDIESNSGSHLSTATKYGDGESGRRLQAVLAAVVLLAGVLPGLAGGCLPFEREGVCASDDECPDDEVCDQSTHSCRSPIDDPTDVEPRDVGPEDADTSEDTTDVVDADDGGEDLTGGDVDATDMDGGDADAEDVDARDADAADAVDVDGGDADATVSPCEEFEVGDDLPSPPTTQTVPRFWLRADHVATSESKVECWRDLSGRGLHFTPLEASPIADTAPTVDKSNAEIEDQSAIDFSGNDSLSMLGAESTSTNTRKATMYVVVNTREYPGALLSGCALDCQGGTCSADDQVRFEDQLSLFFQRGSENKKLTIPSSGDPTSWKIFGVTFRLDTQSPDSIEVRRFVGGGVSSTDVAELQGSDFWKFNTVGSHCDDKWLVGKVAELIFYDEALSGESRDSIEQYLGNRYGISL